MTWISKICERNFNEVTGRYRHASDEGLFLDFLVERMFSDEVRKPDRHAPAESSSPAWWWLAADAYEAEIGSLDGANTIKSVVDALYAELEKHPEKTHLGFIKQYKIGQDLKI